jgi:sigma-B regulation protein RsbU (phosphoserine phosphatase)
MNGYLNNAPCGYFSFSDEGRLQEVNDTLCLLLKTSREELLGQKIENILTLPGRIFYQTHLFPLLKLQGHAEEIFITLLAKDKTQLPVLLNAQKKDEGPAIHYACVAITVHNRKKFEDELVDARNKAQQALQENAALNAIRQELQQHAEELDEQLALVKKMNGELQQFNRVVNHELQEPLRKISVFASMLKRPDLPGTNAHFYNNLDKLLKANERLKAVVSGLQQFIWLQEAPLELAKVNPGDLLKAAYGKIVKEFGLELTALSLEEMPRLMADSKQLELLFYHTLCNCINFRKKEEKVCISVKGTVLQKNRFREVADRYKYEDFLRIDISDNGIGLDTRFKEQAFELFKRLHPTLEGTGIGLALCKKIVENHSGYITIDGEEGKGATLSVFLPLR